MLLRFRVSNFRSFRDQQELSLIANSAKEHSNNLIRSSGLDESILPVCAVYGANASGKSNLLKAFDFMATAVRHSQAKWEPNQEIPREPFAGNREDAGSSFEVDFLDDGVRYQYGFTVSNVAVLEEWLHVYPKGKRQEWFTRKHGKPMKFGARITGDNRVIERLTRPNSLFLSAAAQFGHKALSPVYNWLRSQYSIIGGRLFLKEIVGSFCQRSEENWEGLLSLLDSADLGIIGMEVREDPVSTESHQQIATAAGSSVDGLTRFRLTHRIGDSLSAFDWRQESEGTLAYIALLPLILSALNTGTVLCIDELDASLHPLLATQIVKLFSDPAKNPKGSQLVFNTHDTNLLSADVLRRDQIWFAEKRSDGSSVLYPLTDFKPRKEENLENGYLQGRYGAIPFLNADRFLRAIGGANETGG